MRSGSGRPRSQLRTRLNDLSVFLRLGCTSFGGPIAHLGYFRTELVERRGWCSEETYAEIIAVAQSLPGPASSQVVFSLGLLRGGWLGGLAAWMGFTLPSAAPDDLVRLCRTIAARKDRNRSRTWTSAFRRRGGCTGNSRDAEKSHAGLAASSDCAHRRGDRHVAARPRSALFWRLPLALSVEQHFCAAIPSPVAAARLSRLPPCWNDCGACLPGAAHRQRDHSQEQVQEFFRLAVRSI